MKKRGFIYWFTPFGRLSDSVVDLKDSLQSTKKMLVPDKVEREAEARSATSLSEEDPRSKFEALYLQNGWSQKELATQKLALVRSRRATLFMAALVFLASLFLLATGSTLIQLVALPLCMLVIVLSLTQAFRFAHFEFQIDLRSLISAQDFLSAPDFWRRLIR